MNYFLKRVTISHTLGIKIQINLQCSCWFYPMFPFQECAHRHTRSPLPKSSISCSQRLSYEELQSAGDSN